LLLLCGGHAVLPLSREFRLSPPYGRAMVQ
jgi:hypothetical protein